MQQVGRIILVYSVAVRWALVACFVILGPRLLLLPELPCVIRLYQTLREWPNPSTVCLLLWPVSFIVIERELARASEPVDRRGNMQYGSLLRPSFSNVFGVIRSALLSKYPTYRLLRGIYVGFFRLISLRAACLWSLALSL